MTAPQPSGILPDVTKPRAGAGEMAQRLAQAALPEDQGFIPGTHIASHNHL